MLKKRSRPVSSSNQGLMADPFLLHSPTSNYNKPQASPLFPLSPRVFVGFSPKGGFWDHEAPAMSPTSILETKPFTNPFFTEKTPRMPPQEPKKAHQPIGLGIVDDLKKPTKSGSRMVLFGSQLKIQIPSAHQSPVEFGVKNRDAQLALLLPAAGMRSPSLVSGCISASEMEMSEDYTCVIAHGPNPKTIHIFDNCIVESCGDGFAAVTPRNEAAVTPRNENRVSDDFLTCCHACKKKLGPGKDIFMYRGEKAFCSRECRYQEILMDEEMEDCSPDPSAVI